MITTRQYNTPHNDDRIISLSEIHPNVVDLSGQVFGRLTALGIVRIPGSNKLYWLFSCSCGGEKISTRRLVTPTAGRRGKGCTRSCGCLLKELVEQRGTKEPKIRSPRVHHYLEIEGTTKTIAEWSKLHRLPRHTIFERLRRGKTGVDLIAPIKANSSRHLVVKAG